MRFSSAAEFDRVETERLVLRRPTAADLEDIFRIHGDPATWTHSPEAVHVERAESERFLRRWLAHWDEWGHGYWTIERGEDVIGFGGLERMRGWHGLRDVLNVYYRFAPSAWGRGYATEMVNAAVALAARALPELPLVARVRPTNEESARVALRAGFERRPELDESDLLVYALGWD